MMTQDELEKDEIWKKLNGDFDDVRLRNEYQFTSTGDGSTYIVETPPTYKDYEMLVAVGGIIQLRSEYTLHQVGGLMALDFDEAPSVGSDILIKICY